MRQEKRSVPAHSFTLALCVLAAVLLTATPGHCQQGCDPLPAPSGNVINVYPADVSTLASTVSGAASGDTILLHDGTYDLRDTLYFTTAGVTLRSASGNRNAVIIDGGYSAGSSYLTGELIAIAASDVTIADLTLRYAYYHPIHIWDDGTITSGILLHNLRIVDPGEQAIKVNPSNGSYIDNSTIQCCSIELTDFGRTQIRNSCYTGGIDVHQAWGWVVRRNYIEGFWCDEGFSEHGIHFWKGCRDTLVEENVIVDCARGIGFGLGSSTVVVRTYADDPYPGVGYMGHIDGIIRNNFVAASDPGLFASVYGFDTGVSLEQAHGAELVHNSVASTADPMASSMEWRFDNTLVHVANNLVTNRLWTRPGAVATLEGNLDYSPTTWFTDVPSGDLHLSATANAAVDAGVTLTAGLCDTDIDGHGRDAAPDVGADEASGEIFSDGFESGNTSAWTATVP